MTIATRQSRIARLSGRTVLYGVLTLAVLSVTGAFISVASDLSPNLIDAMGPDGRLSIPLPMMVLQVAMAVAAASSRRVVAMVGSGFVALALLAGVISGFFDGGYADDRLTAFERREHNEDAPALRQSFFQASASIRNPALGALADARSCRD